MADHVQLRQEEVDLLLAHDYEVTTSLDGVTRVRPPATRIWYRGRVNVLRELSFVRDYPEQALAVGAMARLGADGMGAAFRLWRTAVDGCFSVPERE